MISAALIFGVNAGFRFDKAFVAPIAFQAGMSLDWYEQKDVSLHEIGADNFDEAAEILIRQSFSIEQAAIGHHEVEGSEKWYVFDLAEADVVYATKFSTTWGLCSQTAGVAINKETKKARLLNPGGTCV